MNKAMLAALNGSERQFIRETESTALEGLDEDALAALHDRVRRARNKYTGLYRRGAAGQVKTDAARAKASAKHEQNRIKAEVFEDALARVSQRLARAARQSATDLKNDRLAAARKTKSVPARKAQTRKPRSSAAPAGTAKAKVQRRTPATKASRAKATASKARSQAKRDSR